MSFITRSWTVGDGHFGGHTTVSAPEVEVSDLTGDMIYGIELEIGQDGDSFFVTYEEARILAGIMYEAANVAENYEQSLSELPELPELPDMSFDFDRPVPAVNEYPEVQHPAPSQVARGSFAGPNFWI